MGNKVASEGLKALIERELKGIPVLGYISFNDKILASDIERRAAFSENELLLKEVRVIKKGLVELASK